MKINLVSKLTVIFGYMLLGGACVVHASPESSGISVEREEREAKSLYTCYTGKSADFTNVVQSLKAPRDVIGEYTNANEVLIALKLIPFLAVKPAALIPDVMVCYQQNSNSLIRLACINVIYRIDEKVADKLAREYLLNDHDVDTLSGKLGLARRALKKGALYGYPVLRDGLMSSKEQPRKLAKELMDEFEIYDGKIYDDGSKCINLSALKKEICGKTLNEFGGQK